MNTAIRVKNLVKNITLKLILILLALIIIYIIFLQGFFYIRANYAETGVLVEGELKSLTSLDCITVKKETLIYPTVSGTIEMLADEGERVRTGQDLAEVFYRGAGTKPGGRTVIRAPLPGIVSNRIDGLEKILTPESAAKLDMQSISKPEGDSEAAGLNQDKTCEKDRPVLKIIDNLAPLLVYFTVTGYPGSDGVKKGDNLILVWNDIEISGQVVDSVKTQPGTGILVAVDKYPPGLTTLRYVNMDLVAEKTRGYLVQRSSLSEKSGRQGIYVLDRKAAGWVPVEVKAIVGDRAAVSLDDVSVGHRYIINPAWYLLENLNDRK